MTELHFICAPPKFWAVVDMARAGWGGRHVLTWLEGQPVVILKEVQV